MIYVMFAIVLSAPAAPAPVPKQKPKPVPAQVKPKPERLPAPLIEMPPAIDPEPPVSKKQLAVERNARTIITESPLLQWGQDGKIIRDARHVGWYNMPGAVKAFRKAAIQLELLDDREWILKDELNEDIFLEQVRTLQWRWGDLMKAPPVADADRLPFNIEQIRERKNFNREYLKTLKLQEGLHWNKKWFQAAIEETEDLYRAYDLLEDAKNKDAYVHTRREYLDRLRRLVGDKAYYGNFPPHVPIWRFRFVN